MNPAEFEVCYGPAEYRHLAGKAGESPVNLVIDLLRATSTIITGCAHGALGFRPVGEVAEARLLATGLEGAMLGGERGGVKPEGFDRGNSPREYTEAVTGRQVVFTTTNGTQAFVSCPPREEAWAVGFLNLGSVIRRVREAGRPVRVICAGTGPDFALEDGLVAGALACALAPEHPVAALYRMNRSRVEEVMRRSRNGRRLVALGLGDDVAWCAQQDRYAVIPRRGTDGWIRVC